MSDTLALRSPAKLNLFLHVTGRRADGYHLLQTVFQLLDFCDGMRFTATATPDWCWTVACRAWQPKTTWR